MLLEEKTTMTDDLSRLIFKWGKSSGKTTGIIKKTLLLRRSLHRQKERRQIFLPR